MRAPSRLALLRAVAFATAVSTVSAAFSAAPTQVASPPQSDGESRAPAPPPADLERYRHTVVRIDARAVQGAPSSETLGVRRSGSGVILGERMVLTIGYLLLEVDHVEVTTSSGRRTPAAVAGYDHATGFGLVRTVLPLDGAALALGDSDAVAVRQKVLTIGQGESAATELVVISRKVFTGSWEYLLERPIFTFPPVNNWSGSALMTTDGKLVGIGSLIVGDASADQPGVPGNLFVPVNLLKPIFEDLLAKGRRGGPAQPWLGMSTEMVRGHLMVTRVTGDGPAQAAGVNTGDIVVAVDAERFADQADFYRRVWRLGPAGTTVPLKVIRNGELRDLKVKSVDRADVLRKPVGI